MLLTRGLAPVRHVLSNGARLLAKQTGTTPAVAINLAFCAGSVHDPTPLPGLAHFAARMLDRGTERRSAERIAEELEDRGVALNVVVTRHLLSLTCTCLAEDFDAVLELLADVAIHPTFPDVEIERRRREIVTVLRQDEDNPAVQATEGVLALLYPGGHPYGRRSKGTVESVQALDRGALVEFHQVRLAPDAMSLVVVGDVAPAAVVESMDRAFGRWRSTAATAVLPGPPPPAFERRRLVRPMMNKAQADIAYGFVTVSRTDPAYHAYYVMNNILGQYGLGGRLGERIRERQGMAYYAFSSFDANVITGPLLIRAGVGPDDVDRAVASIDEEVGKMAAEGVTEQELADAQRYLIGSIPRTLETNAGIANFLQTAEQFGLGADYDEQLPALIASVTREAVFDACRRVLAPERAAVAIAGPYRE